MSCPQCAKEIPLGLSYCPRCGISIAAAAPLSAMPANSETSAASSIAPTVLAAAVVPLTCFVIVMRLSLISTHRNYPSMSPEATGFLFGHTIGAYLIPLIGVFLYYKFRGKKPTPTRRIVVISLWALGFALLAASGERNLSKPLTQDEMNRRIGLLAREGAGQAPLSANQTKWDGPIRSFFADIKSSNEAYQKEIAQADISALKTLYTAGSFKSQDSIAETLSQLHATLALDDKYASMQPIYDKLKERIFAVDASQSEKESVWRGFESSSRQASAPRDATIAEEHKWIQASIDLYEFVQANQGSYSLRGGKLIFKGTDLASTFNEKLHQATQLRTEFKTTRAAFHKSQGESLGKFGLQPSDLSVPAKK